MFLDQILCEKMQWLEESKKILLATALQVRLLLALLLNMYFEESTRKPLMLQVHYTQAIMDMKRVWKIPTMNQVINATILQDPKSRLDINMRYYNPVWKFDNSSATQILLHMYILLLRRLEFDFYAFFALFED